MVSISRRDLFWLGSAAGLRVLMPRARAQAIAAKIEDVSAEILAGDFTAAAERLELGVAEYPLDRERRTDLAIAQFAAQMFAEAEKNLGRIVKLERGFAGRPGGLDIEYKQAWFHVAQLRAGHKPEPRNPQAPASLLAVLNGTVSPRDFAQHANTLREDAIARMKDSIEDVVVTDGTITVKIKLSVDARPDTEPSYLCVASLMLGEAALTAGKVSEAKASFEAALDTNAESQIEYHIAKAERARLA